MKTISQPALTDWLASCAGITGAPGSERVEYVASGTEACWLVPDAAAMRPALFARALQLLAWDTCLVWRPSGVWPAAGDVDPVDDTAVIEQRTYEALGLPLGTSDAVELESSEGAALLTLMFTTSTLGWNVGHDLLVVPSHGRQFLTLTHHDKLFVRFRLGEDATGWFDELAASGYETCEPAAAR